MQVVIAQHHGDVIAMGIEPTQHVDIARAAINQITHAPQAVFIRIELHLLQQALERLETALNIADDVGAHWVSCLDFRSRSVSGHIVFDKALRFFGMWPSQYE